MAIKTERERESPPNLISGKFGHLNNKSSWYGCTGGTSEMGLFVISPYTELSVGLFHFDWLHINGVSEVICYSDTH